MLHDAVAYLNEFTEIRSSEPNPLILTTDKSIGMTQ